MRVFVSFLSRFSFVRRLSGFSLASCLRPFLSRMRHICGADVRKTERRSPPRCFFFFSFFADRRGLVRRRRVVDRPPRTMLNRVLCPIEVFRFSSPCAALRCLTALPAQVLQHCSVQLFFTSTRPPSHTRPAASPSCPPTAAGGPTCPSGPSESSFHLGFA